MAKRQKSASDLVDEMNGLGDEIQKATVREVRKYLGERLAGMATGNDKGDQEIRDCMEAPEFEPSADFIAGLRFAAELVSDPNFDY